MPAPSTSSVPEFKPTEIFAKFTHGVLRRHMEAIPYNQNWEKESTDWLMGYTGIDKTSAERVLKILISTYGPIYSIRRPLPPT